MTLPVIKTTAKLKSMPLRFGLSVCKWIFGFFNLLIFICGAALLGTGAWLIVKKKFILAMLKATEALSEDEDPTVQSFNNPSVLVQASYILIVAGAVIFVLGFLGCYGAIQESKWMLATYAVILTIVISVEIGSGVSAASQIKANLKSALFAALKLYGPENDVMRRAWDNIFTQFECCGVDGFRDLKVTPWYKTNRTTKYQEKFPRSCCVMERKQISELRNPNCPFVSSLADRNQSEVGCYTKITNAIKLKIRVIKDSGDSGEIKDSGEDHMSHLLGNAMGLGATQVEANVKSALYAALKLYGPENDEMRLAWDNVFTQYECCGVDGYRDLEVTPWYKTNRTTSYQEKFPRSCCVMEKKEHSELRNPNCPFLSSLADRKQIEIGCYTKIKDWGPDHMSHLFGSAIGLGAIEVEANLKSALFAALKLYGPENDIMRLAWDNIFTQFECCGVDGFKDLEVTPWYKTDRTTKYQEKFPRSCCVMEKKQNSELGNPYCPFRSSLADRKQSEFGCYTKIKDSAEDHVSHLLGIVIGLGAIQILAVLFSCCLCCFLNGKKRP